MNRLLPVCNRRFAAARELCAAKGAPGSVKLQSNAAITAQGCVTRLLDLTGGSENSFFMSGFSCIAQRAFYKISRIMGPQALACACTGETPVPPFECELE
ncbi:MAG: hypothetical protein ACYC6G_13570 [Desulfobaccales bacterium]